MKRIDFRRVWICPTIICLAFQAAAFGQSDATGKSESEANPSVKLDVILKELHPDQCWFHPRIASVPGAGTGGQPAVLLTLQRHLRVSDHYSGLYYMRSNDLGKSWSVPRLPPGLDWKKESDGVTIAVCDVTPGWHASTGKVIAIGVKLRYGLQGEHLYDQPKSHECAYAVYDPKNDAWSNWKMLQTPETDGKFYLLVPGCTQWQVKSDGEILLPVYYRGRDEVAHRSTVLRCSFDGREMVYLGHGSELELNEVRGLVEPSLCQFQGKYYLTLRNDNRGYVTSSMDGLHYQAIQPWTFDNGEPLGSYNTQQHWVPHKRELYLAYTRKGANNDHIPRNRAPLFAARVDPQQLNVIRKTEVVLIPERGVQLGNFGGAMVTENEAWVTDAEFLLSNKPHARGADGSVFAARLTWK